MHIFFSYSREDRNFVDNIAISLVGRKHNIWLDRWEMNVGDSLIDKIQSALTESSAILVILSKNSVASEWCKKELNSGLVRELSEKKVLILPCVIDDCEIPLFLKEKLYADFRSDKQEALDQVHNALLRITNQQQGRLDNAGIYTDWCYDWKQGKGTGAWYFEWMFVDHGPAIEYCVLTRCQIACNDVASTIFQNLREVERQKYILRAFASVVGRTSKMSLTILLQDAFEKFETLLIQGIADEEWFAEISSRRMGVDIGKDTLVHVGQIFERAYVEMEARSE